MLRRRLSRSEYVSSERLFSSIFEGQIKILQALSAGALPTDCLTPFYEAEATQRPELFSSYSFQQYLGYLTCQELIQQQPGGYFAITRKGRKFLTYRARERRTLERAD